LADEDPIMHAATAPQAHGPRLVSFAGGQRAPFAHLCGEKIP
jgi:hypothetical protein